MAMVGVFLSEVSCAAARRSPAPRTPPSRKSVVKSKRKTLCADLVKSRAIMGRSSFLSLLEYYVLQQSAITTEGQSFPLVSHLLTGEESWTSRARSSSPRLPSSRYRTYGGKNLSSFSHLRQKRM